MSELEFEVISATNYLDAGIFNRLSTSYVGWQSSRHALAPIHILIKCRQLSLLSQVYLEPSEEMGIPLIEVLVSEDNINYASVAKVHGLYRMASVEVMVRCRYVRLAVLGKEQSKAVGIERVRLLGHVLAPTQSPTHSQLHHNVDRFLIDFGLDAHDPYDVDVETLSTLHDMSLLHVKWAAEGRTEQLQGLIRDIRTVTQLGESIRTKEQRIEELWAKKQTLEIKEVQDELKVLRRKRDKYDEKYETTRFEESLALDNDNNRQQSALKALLEQDEKVLLEAKQKGKMLVEQAKVGVDNEIEGLNQDRWWEQHNQLDQVEKEEIIVQSVGKKEKHKENQDKQFLNEYVYNAGDVEMEKHLGPLLKELSEEIGDPEVLRKYEQLKFLDVLGARIWMSAHSENWRQRSAAVEAVLRFSRSPLPSRYAAGQTRNLFLALMEFARLNAEDPVLQVYYNSLNIMTTALQPPICGEDVPPAVVNKAIQRFMAILVAKVSEMNARAKEVSLNTIIQMFRHPLADPSIAVQECLRICRPDQTVKFTPVDKLNPRVVISRIEIVSHLLGEFNLDKRKNDLQEVLSLLLEGALNHYHNDVRAVALPLLSLIQQQQPKVVEEWHHHFQASKPIIAKEIEKQLFEHHPPQ